MEWWARSMLPYGVTRPQWVNHCHPPISTWPQSLQFMPDGRPSPYRHNDYARNRYSNSRWPELTPGHSQIISWCYKFHWAWVGALYIKNSAGKRINYLATGKIVFHFLPNRFFRFLTHCGLVTLSWPYDDIYLGQHLCKQWLVAWWQQATTWTNGDLTLVGSCCTHLRSISQEVLDELKWAQYTC